MSERCCVPRVPSAPVHPTNRPGHGALAFRIGTFATFREAMLDAIAREPALAALRTRASNDFAIAPVEAWAALADVLTFYQERYANEGYLRTARLRDSVVRLVRLVDYRLAPGAAATTLAAFTLEHGAHVTIPAGVRVQSVPQGSAPPVKFETLEALDADAALDRLRAFDAPRALNNGDTAFAYVDPTDDAGGGRALAAGQQLIAFDATAFDVLAVAKVVVDDDRIRVEWASPGTTTRAVTLAARTVHVLGAEARVFGHDAPPQYSVATQTIVNGKPFISARLAGSDYSWDGLAADTKPGQHAVLLDAPAPRFAAGTRVLVVTSTSTAGPPSFAGGTLHAFAGTVTANQQIRAIRGPLAATTSKLVIAFDDTGHPVPDNIVSTRVFELAGPPIRFWNRTFPPRVVSRVLHVPGVRRGAHAIELGRVFAGPKTVPGNVLDMAAFPAGRTVIAGDGASAFAARAERAELIARTLAFAPAPTDTVTIVTLGLGEGASRVTAVVSASRPDDLIELTTPAPELSVRFGTRPPVTVVLDGFFAGTWYAGNVSDALGTALAAAARSLGIAAPLVFFIPGGIYVAALDASDEVTIGATSTDPATAAAIGFEPEQVQFADGVLGAPVAPPAQPVVSAQVRVAFGTDPPHVIEAMALAPGDNAVAMANQLRTALHDEFAGMAPFVTTHGDRLVVIPRAAPAPAFLRVTLSNGEPYDLDAANAVLLGNVVAASHGESVHAEIVGDGDASAAFQRFTPRKKPVTHLVDPRTGDLRSTLTLAFNGIAWREVPSLYGAGAADRVYATSIADDAALTAQTGDGESGARPPSGRSNAVATYRVGLGTAGNLPANVLTTLLDRPNGLRAATNPVPAEGGANPQTLADARTRAPSTVRTFGRAISLADFEDVSLSGGLLAKARATWVWDGESRAIHLTVAGPAGAQLSPAALATLRATLLAHRDPNHRLIVADYIPVPIVARARLLVDDTYLRADVVSRARAALLASLSFDALDFGEAVHLSAVYATLQDVEGVIGVTVEDLDFKTKDAAFRTAHRRDPLERPQAHVFMLPARPAPGTVLSVLPAELATVESPDMDVVLEAGGGRTE